jgi:RNA polymerase sigma-70 factor (ECF subfamily)
MSAVADGLAQRTIAAALATNLEGGFERLVVAYQHRVFAFALHLMGDAHEAEELAQDAFVAAYRALRGYAAERRRSLALRPWLFTIVLNRVRNRARRAKPMSLDGEGGRAASQALASPASDEPAAIAARSESSAELRRAIATLPQRNRAAVVLRHIEGLGYEEISAMLGRPAVTVRSDVHRGVGLLRKYYEEKKDDGFRASASG